MPTIGQGLMIGGSALAQGMSERYARKQQEQKFGQLLQALLGDQMTPEQVPGYQQQMAASIPQLAQTMGATGRCRI